MFFFTFYYMVNINLSNHGKLSKNLIQYFINETIFVLVQPKPFKLSVVYITSYIILIYKIK